MKQSPFQRNEWIDAKRAADEMRIEEHDGLWIVIPPDDRPRLNTCACCGLPFETKRAAQLIADAVYPLPEVH